MRMRTVIDLSITLFAALLQDQFPPCSSGRRRRFPATDIAACYLRRWEIETSYQELKQTMLGGPLTMRSQEPEGITQELWGALIAYNLVRLEMSKAAIEAKAQLTDLSFIRALHLIQHELLFAAATRAYSNITGKLKQ